MCILYNQQDAIYAEFFIIIGALHVSGILSTHDQELIKMCVQLWVLSYFPAVYRWCGWGEFQPNHTSGRQQDSMTIPKAAHTVL